MGPRATAAVPHLLTHLRGDDERLARSAAYALGAIRAEPAEVIPVLAELAREDGTDAAAWAIGAYGREGWDAAVALLRDADPDVQYTALSAFRAMGEAAAPIVTDLVAMIRGDDYQLALRAVETVGAIGPAAHGAIPAILDRLSWGDAELPAKTAGPALARLGPRAEAPVREALQSKNYVTHSQALAVLAHFRGRSHFALDELEALAGSADAPIRRTVVAAAGAALPPPVPDGLPRPMGGPPPGPDLSGLSPAVVARLRALFERLCDDPDEQTRRTTRTYLEQVDAGR